MLNLMHATRGVLPPSMEGGHVLWMGTPSMDLSTSRVQHSPSVYFIPFSSPRPLFQSYWPTPSVDFPPRDGLQVPPVNATIHGWGLSTSRVQQVYDAYWRLTETLVRGIVREEQRGTFLPDLLCYSLSKISRV